MKVQNTQAFKQQALKWANTLEVCCCLDSNNYEDKYGKYDFLLAAGAKETLETSAGEAFELLKSFYDKHQNWLFGLLGYDLKNEVEQLKSVNTDELSFPDLFFFVPEYLMVIKNDQLSVLIGNEHDVLNQIEGVNKTSSIVKESLNIQSRISKETYLKTVIALQQHIQRGDIYEVNFCQEFFALNAAIDPLAVYTKLNLVSPTPFSGFFKIKDRYILSASPERYLCKQDNKLISQPIKGTARRSTKKIEDERIKLELRQDAKEQAENVMIVDLVRNDLTKCALKGTVKVEELFGIYGFKQVYQMISTISCLLNPDVHIIDAIKSTFPMGSMTGAPKISAMEIIDTYEFSKRGAYSGSFGYITPEGDFDFNVVIRSILYNADTQYLSFHVGGAITYAANAEDEYNECMLKASAIIETLTSK